MPFTRTGTSLREIKDRRSKLDIRIFEGIDGCDPITGGFKQIIRVSQKLFNALLNCQRQQTGSSVAKYCATEEMCQLRFCCSVVMLTFKNV